LAGNRAALETALGQAVAELQAQGVALDATLGSVQFIEAAGVRHPIAGGEEYEGVLNKMQVRKLDAGRYQPYVGTGWLQIVALGDEGAQAEGFLGYSQSTDPLSPHRHDQLPLQSTLTTRPMPALR
ncbi:MAG: penicillin acylase family protein, partial [Rhizobiales bacterium]|nr:penicillin acylase family protein [Rhizobacter sp.]